MDLKNLTELELYFANHFDTVLFPVLAEIYLTKGEYDRAKRVCQIGLEHHSDSSDGQFILSQAEMGMGNLAAAEKLMKKVLAKYPNHRLAATTLPLVQEQLGRSSSTLKISFKRSLSVDPNNQFAKDYLSKKQKKTAKKPDVLKYPKKKKSQKLLPNDISLDGVSVSPRLATFTLVNVFKGQGLYHQALDILNILEKKGEDKKRIAQERKAIKASL